MSFTEAGLAWLAELLVSNAADARIIVSDGASQKAATTVTSIERDGATIRAVATFGEGEANFDWRERSLVVGDQVIDTEKEDQGRKVAGAAWTVEVEIDLSA